MIFNPLTVSWANSSQDLAENTARDWLKSAFYSLNGLHFDNRQLGLLDYLFFWIGLGKCLFDYFDISFGITTIILDKHRSIILAKGEFYWVYEFLFAKNDLDNIDDNELENFRKLAGLYAKLSDDQIEKLLQNKSLVPRQHSIFG